MDSLTQLIEKERLITKNDKRTFQDQIEKINLDYTVLSKKNDSLNIQLKYQVSNVLNLQLKNDSLLIELQKSLNQKRKYTLEYKEKVVKFIDEINAYCQLPKSNFFDITENKEKGVKVINFDFSNLGSDDLVNYNVENYEGLNFKIYLKMSNELIYGKATRSCCIADNQEIIFFFLDTDFIVFDHSAGQFGGTLTTYKNGKLINDNTYELSEESTVPMELFIEF